MPMIKELYITIVKNKFDADTFFSKINTSQFNLVWEECHEADEKNKFDYCFQKWIRN
jgi:dihydrofolate reductase